MELSELEILEKFTAEERERIEQKEKEAYESGPHVEFELNAWVTDGTHIGTVQHIWEKGYINVDIKNGRGGLCCETRASKYVYLDDQIRDYFTQEQELVVSFTGEDIEAMFGSYLGMRNVNPSKTKDKLINALEKLRLTRSE